MGILEEIAPSYMGEERIGLQLDPTTSRAPRALQIVDVIVDLSDTLPAGIVYPVEMTVQSPSRINYLRQYFRSPVGMPSIISFRTQEGGTHTIRVAEVGHNRWYGALTFEVLGDTTTQ